MTTRFSTNTRDLLHHMTHHCQMILWLRKPCLQVTSCKTNATPPILSLSRKEVSYSVILSQRGQHTIGRLLLHLRAESSHQSLKIQFSYHFTMFISKGLHCLFGFHIITQFNLLSVGNFIVYTVFATFNLANITGQHHNKAVYQLSTLPVYSSRL